jgi:hypothetical protein
VIEDLSQTACELRATKTCRGAIRLLHSLNYATATEISLGSARRADIVALGPTGELLIVEVKSGIADFRADEKWPDYWASCDRLLFAVSREFPADLIPAEAGLIVADGYGGALIRNGEHRPLPASARKAMLIRFARASATRLAARDDPRLADVL